MKKKSHSKDYKEHKEIRCEHDSLTQCWDNPVLALFMPFLCHKKIMFWKLLTVINSAFRILNDDIKSWETGHTQHCKLCRLFASLSSGGQIKMKSWQETSCEASRKLWLPSNALPSSGMRYAVVSTFSCSPQQRLLNPFLSSCFLFRIHKHNHSRHPQIPRKLCLVPAKERKECYRNGISTAEVGRNFQLLLGCLFNDSASCMAKPAWNYL